MLFKDLYEFAAAQGGPHVRFEDLRSAVNARHQQIGRVDTIRVKYPLPTSSAYYRLADSDRSSPYDEEFNVAEIVYCSSLDDDPEERRFALTKELMHVFDTQEEMASSRQRFIQLMKEVQNRPLPQHASAMYRSESDTRWMAALALCPKNLRSPFVAPFAAKDVSIAEIAELFRLPEWVAVSIMDDYYDVAYEALINGNGLHS